MFDVWDGVAQGNALSNAQASNFHLAYLDRDLQYNDDPSAVRRARDAESRVMVTG